VRCNAPDSVQMDGFFFLLPLISFFLTEFVVFSLHSHVQQHSQLVVAENFIGQQNKNPPGL
jgi:hypothetical protein